MVRDRAHSERRHAWPCFPSRPMLSLCVTLFVGACGGEVIEADPITVSSTGSSTVSSTGSGASTSTPYVLAIRHCCLHSSAIVFDAAVAVEGGVISMTLQPLLDKDRVTPVGEPRSVGPFPVDDSGLYMASFEMMIPAEAIPYCPLAAEPGTPIPSDIQLYALEPTCGLASGSLNYGIIEMFGSCATFAMVPASDPEARAHTVIDCSGTYAGWPAP